MSGRRIFVLVFFAFGVWAMAVGLQMGIEGWNAGKWPVAQGRMIRFGVSEYRTSSNIRVARLCLDLDYLYMVGGRVLEGRRLDAGWRCFAAESRIRELADKYPSGSELSVYYNPSDPSRALLEPGIPWASFLLCGTGLVIFSTVWAFWRNAIRSDNR